MSTSRRFHCFFATTCKNSLIGALAWRAGAPFRSVRSREYRLVERQNAVQCRTQRWSTHPLRNRLVEAWMVIYAGIRGLATVMMSLFRIVVVCTLSLCVSAVAHNVPEENPQWERGCVNHLKLSNWGEASEEIRDVVAKAYRENPYPRFGKHPIEAMRAGRSPKGDYLVVRFAFAGVRDIEGAMILDAQGRPVSRLYLSTLEADWDPSCVY